MIEFDSLSLSILGPAFVTGLLVLATHVPLGREVINRGIIFIDLAIAQIAALGVLIARATGFESHGWQLQLCAVASALIAALILSWCETRWPKIQEAIIGVSFVLAATAALIVTSKDPHGAEYLNEILAGQILWVSWPQLLSLAVVNAAILFFIISGRLSKNNLSFYLLFAVAITTSVQFVGVYLVFASLIIPALFYLKQAVRRANIHAFIIAAIAYAIGLIASALFDLPSGPAIVWALLLVFLLAQPPKLTRPKG